MPYDLSVEYPHEICLITTRTIASRLWFINNPLLEQRILAHLGKYQAKYNVEIFGFILMGNHYHLLARFPDSNRFKFTKAFNSIIAKLTKRHAEEFIDGKLWARRARSQIVPNFDDVERVFTYLVLNPVSSGLVPRIGDFAGYRCFEDTVNGNSEIYKLVNWSAYQNKKRHNEKLKPSDFEEEYSIQYTRLPGYENYSRNDYRKAFQLKFSLRQSDIANERRSLNLGFAGKDILKKLRPGMLPRTTKTSERYTPRPLVLTSCRETKELLLNLYFRTLLAFRIASRKFMDGQLDVAFPPGTHRPPLFLTTA